MSEPSEQDKVPEFEGTKITEMQAKLPMIVVDLEDSYARGTILRLNLEVRVKSVRLEENKTGDLTRQHILGLEGIHLTSVFQREESFDDVGGSASAHPTPDAETAEELGVDIRRTSELWPPG